MSKSLDVLEQGSATPRKAGARHPVFDFVCAAIGLLFLSPLFCAIALAIKLDDDGSVFYKQVRIGRSFCRFRLWKFRSMVCGADSLRPLTGPEDPRLTHVGQWLRRYKLDELPQLLNVLKGDMQLVGPRPELECFVEMFRSQYASLLEERPGITDPAAIAYRHEADILSCGQIEEQYVHQILPAKLKLSLDYQKSRNWWSDIRVLLQTAAGLIT